MGKKYIVEERGSSGAGCLFLIIVIAVIAYICSQ